MSKKITWDKVREAFKKSHPKLDKRVLHWQPYSFATIVLMFDNGRKATYNYDTKLLAYIN